MFETSIRRILVRWYHFLEKILIWISPEGISGPQPGTRKALGFCHAGLSLRPARDLDPQYPIIPLGFYPIEVDVVWQCNLASESAVVDLHR